MPTSCRRIARASGSKPYGLVGPMPAQIVVTLALHDLQLGPGLGNTRVVDYSTWPPTRLARAALIALCHQK